MNKLARMTMVRNAAGEDTESRRQRDGRGRYTSEGDYDNRRMEYESRRMDYDSRTRSEYHPYYNTYPERNGNSPMEGDPTRGPSRGSRQYEEEMERPESREYHITTDRSGNGTFRGEDEGKRMIGYGNVESHYRYPDTEDEMSSRSSHKERGYSHSEGVPELTKAKAKEWVRSMRPSTGGDKEKGERWSYDETTSILRQHGWEHDPAEWYAILHAMYYDYCKVAKKYGQGNNPEFYVDLAHAWLDDKDANEDKAALYYAKIAKH